MALDFPDSPTVGDIFAISDRQWTWNGTSWNLVITQGGSGSTLGNIDAGTPTSVYGGIDPIDAGTVSG